MAKENEGGMYIMEILLEAIGAAKGRIRVEEAREKIKETRDFILFHVKRSEVWLKHAESCENCGKDKEQIKLIQNVLKASKVAAAALAELDAAYQALEVHVISKSHKHEGEV